MEATDSVTHLIDKRVRKEGEFKLKRIQFMAWGQ